jgi:ABC transporter substrate binding protein
MKSSQNSSRKTSAKEKKSLCSRVLADAIEDFKKYAFSKDQRGQKLFQEAEDWFLEKDDNQLFSFEYIWATFASHLKLVADLAVKNRFPSIYDRSDFPEAGGLMSYGPNVPDMSRRAAIYVDKVFKGTNPGDLPVERPTKFEMVINLKTAKVLGLTIPAVVMMRAEKVMKWGARWQNRIKDLSRWKSFSSLAQTDALAKLLIEKGLITREEFMQKISEERATYQKLFNPTPQWTSAKYWFEVYFVLIASMETSRKQGRVNRWKA